MIIDDYIEYTNTYKAKYGEKCIVLMQVGSFYELYSIKDDTSEDIYSIADICNIQISRKNKSITDVSISNPLMAGFPLYTLKKYTTILLNNNYTIVLVEQITEPPNPERKITEILSPGMNINVTTKKNNYMMVIFYSFIDNLPIVGLAGIDLSTGSCFVYEAGSTKTDPEFVNDEVFRIVTTYNPCELIILSDKKYDYNQKAYLLKSLNLSNILTHYKWEEYEFISSMMKISYQNVILEKAFMVNKKKSLLSIIEILNLERYEYGRIALCCLLQFAYEHNMDIIKQLNIPEILNNNTYLTIEYNSSVQLNIIGLYQNDKPLIDILNRCLTSFGSRIFRERLLKPIIDISLLNKRYDEIDFLLESHKFKKVSKHLCKILDLERIKRKMLLNKFNPQDWNGFNTSLENAIEILKTYYLCDNISEYEDMVKFYMNILDLNEASKYNLNDIKGNIFIKGTYDNIDNLVNEFNEAYNKILNIQNEINNIDLGCCKIDYNDKDGYYISITKKRFDNAKNKKPDYMKQFQIKTLNASSTIKLTNEDTVICSNIIEEKQNAIQKLVLEYYQEFVKNFIDKYNNTLDNLIRAIIDIDIACCNAKNAYEYRYYRPSIVHKEYHHAYINADNIRHPIIERIDNNTVYVGNDIKLSLDNKNGMLLYGINAAGKSSLMKSIGLNIIMAQSGMFVASNNMEYYPYKHIFTRISGMDNIYKGMSSFTVEMTELRNILQRSDKYSLVLGDEICSGTEGISALAIVAAGIDTLVKNKSSFIFATHLHDLTKLEIVKYHIDKYIYIKHIHIIIDENNRIIYERKIKDGQGSPTYGVEVCKSLDMPNDFMKIAENTRKEIQGFDNLLIQPNKSRYNKDLYMTLCGVCGEQKAIDTHHIEYQCNSDNEGFFKDYHKDAKYNLIPLCKSCHQKEHSGIIDIKGYKQTSEGIILDYKENNNSPQDSNKILEYTNNYITEDEYFKLKQYIKRGKCNWYIRNAKTHAFKKVLDNKKIKDKVFKLLNRYIEIDIDFDDNFSNQLFDPVL